MKLSIQKEALQESNGMYRMNAHNARWYAFCHDGNSLVSGEFVYASEGEPQELDFDGYVDLDTNIVVDLRQWL